jgi:hypothetical protein
MDKETNDDDIENGIHNSGKLDINSSGNPINTESEANDGIVECRVIVVNVGHSGHHDKWQVVQDPANSGV